MITIRNERDFRYCGARSAARPGLGRLTAAPENLRAAARRPSAGRRPRLRRRRRQRASSAPSDCGTSPATAAKLPCCSAPWRSRPTAATAASVALWCVMPPRGSVNSATGRSSWSAMRPITAASASRPKRPRRSACRDRSSAIACSRLSLCPARSTPLVAWSRHRPHLAQKAAPAPPNRQKCQKIVDAALELPRPPFRLPARQISPKTVWRLCK